MPTYAAIELFNLPKYQKFLNFRTTDIQPHTTSPLTMQLINQLHQIVSTIATCMAWVRRRLHTKVTVNFLRTQTNQIQSKLKQKVDSANTRKTI